jgi:hypothetical protein
MTRDDQRHERNDRRAGRNANFAGKPRDAKKNVDWLRGWDDAHDDSRLDNADGAEIMYTHRDEPGIERSGLSFYGEKE